MRKRVIFPNRLGTLAIRQQILHLGKWVGFVIVLYALMSYVKSIETDTEFQKIFLARDIAILETTINGLHGNIEYVYYFEKLELSKFKFEFRQSSPLNDKPVVSVEEKGLAKTYPYAKTKEGKYPKPVYGSNSMKFSKKGADVEVKNE